MVFCAVYLSTGRGFIIGVLFNGGCGMLKLNGQIWGWVLTGQAIYQRDN